MKTLNIIFIRHGEIDSNNLGVYSGNSDEPLNINGVNQVEAACLVLKKQKIDLIISSTLKRARQTAEILKKNIGAELVFNNAFNELIMGPWQGLSEEEVKIQFPNEWKIWKTTPSQLSINGRETLKQLYERVRNEISNLYLSSENGSTLCIVSHVAVIRVALILINNYKLDDYPNIQVYNATPIPVTIAKNEY